MTCAPMLFHTGEAVLSALARETRQGALPSAVVVDWERRDKARRQAQARMSIGLVPSMSEDGHDALARVRRHLPQVPVICRIDGPADVHGLELAVAGGATEVLVPMVRHEDEADALLDRAQGRIGVGVMVETRGAVERVDRLVTRPLTRVYLGLVDLALERSSTSIFSAFHDGVVEHVAGHVRGRAAFGVGGLTLPGHGSPVPARLLAGEVLRVGGEFSFLRRSFLQHLGEALPGDGILAVRAMLSDLGARSSEDVRRDHEAFAAIDLRPVPR